MPFPVILAHGALGNWDELIFLSVAAIFIVMMGISWVRSRNTEPDFAKTPPGDEPNTDTPESESPDRFELK